MSADSKRKPKPINLKKVMLKYARQENGGIHLMPSRWYLLLMMGILFMSDYLMMYSSIEVMMYGPLIEGVALAVIMAVIFVVGSSMIASILLMREKNKIHIISAVMLSFIIVAMFVFWGMWQMELQAILYTSSEPFYRADYGENVLTVLETTVDAIRNAGRSYNFLLVTAPIGNSFLCMVITLLDATAESRAKRRVKNYMLKIEEFIEHQEAVVRELEDALKQDLYKEDEELYNEAVKELNAREEMLKMNVRRMIAEYLADPDLADVLFGNKLDTESSQMYEMEGCICSN